MFAFCFHPFVAMRRRYVPLLIVFLMLSVSSAQAMMPKQHDGGLTITTVMRTANAWNSLALQQETIDLGTLQSRTDDTTIVSLRWVHERIGWGFSKWSLQLQTPDNSLVLASVGPEPGRTYDAALSFNPVTGSVHVRVMDAKTEENIAVGGVKVSSMSADVAAHATDETTSPVVAEHHATAHAGYVPLGFSWDVGITDDAGIFLPLQHIDDETSAYMRLVWPYEITPGDVSATVTVGDAIVNSIVLDTAETVVPVSAQPLPVGSSTVTAVVTEHGATATRSKNIKAGRLDMTVENVRIEDGYIRADVSTAASSLPRTSVTITATVSEMMWNSVTRRYEHDVSTTQPVSISDIVVDPQSNVNTVLEMPAPREAGYWRVHFSAQAALDVTSRVTPNEHYVSTYEASFDPDAPAFTIVVLPDTQLYARSYPEIMIRQAQWIAENVDVLNIGAVIHVGDVTEENLRDEWRVADRAYSLLDGVVPYVLTVGNHDLLLKEDNYRIRSRRLTLINEYFPPERFPDLAGVFEPGRIENAFHRLRLGGENYLIVAMEYGPRNEVLQWAQAVLDQHPDDKVILVTHHYLARSGYRTSPLMSSDYPQLHFAHLPDETANDGEEIWHALVRQHANVGFVVSGHVPVTTIPRSVTLNGGGGFVYELLTNYQSEPNGGNGWLVTLQFRSNGTVDVRSYSPYLGTFNDATDEYGFDNHFIIDLDRGRFIRPDVAEAN